ncbi:MarR family transcriptional regulator [Natronorubrum sp. A-ect3]|uniref:MarR family transcriptional regulator n=1 Tax=Natronorubrum sp. A-ect3 TaxID=3242698 RepID=UPI00359D19ED
MCSCSSQKLLSILDERGPVDTSSLAAALGVHPLTVRTACRELHADGYVRQVSSGVYAITAAGKAHLSTRSGSGS